MTAVKLVVTDMDGTLYSWVDYIVPAVEALVESVCRSTGAPRLRVVQSLKEVYARYESNEYPFALQESSLYRDFPDFGSFDRLVIEPARTAFAHARRKYLQPFPHVLETLRALEGRGLPVVALTDAPRNPAEARVRRLGLEGLLDALYTLPGFRFPEAPGGEVLVSPHIRAREERGDYRASLRVVELPREWEKPAPQGLLRVCADFGVAPDEVLLVGDSLRKDVAVAQATGARDAWAEYGTYVSLEYRERLEVVSAPAITRRHAHALLEVAGGPPPPTPSHALSNFGGLLKLL